jgi:fumarate reductase subunit C
MGAWWGRNPFYLWYMVRELSSVFITAYAFVLLTGLARLAQGPAAFDVWRESLARPGALAFHAITLLLVIYHAWTWFNVMPKTLPFLRVAGHRIPDRAIVAAGAGVAVATSIAVTLAVWWFRP